MERIPSHKGQQEGVQAHQTDVLQLAQGFRCASCRCRSLWQETSEIGAGCRPLAEEIGQELYHWFIDTVTQLPSVALSIVVLGRRDSSGVFPFFAFKRAGMLLLKRLLSCQLLGFCYDTTFLILLRHLVLVIFICCQFNTLVKLLDFSHITRVLDLIRAES